MFQNYGPDKTAVLLRALEWIEGLVQDFADIYNKTIVWFSCR